jgi:hypothetical protein
VLQQFRNALTVLLIRLVAGKSPIWSGRTESRYRSWGARTAHLDDPDLATHLQKQSERPESVTNRRDRELRVLLKEGIPVRFESRWKATVGPLHIWLRSGRWHNDKSGQSGRINSLSMRQLLTQWM